MLFLKLAVIFNIFILANVHASGYKRTKLKEFFHNKICQKDLHQIKSQDLWSHKIYDSQIFISILYPDNKHSLSKKNIDLAAKIQMAKEKHRSYVSGKCHSKYVWIVTFPSPVGFESSKLERQLANLCDKVSIQSTPGDIATDLKSIRNEKSNYSSASIICHPKKPNWIGPQEWFLVVGDKVDTLKNKIVSQIPENTKISVLNVFSLVAKIRRFHDLNPLVIRKPIDEIAQRLTRNGSILHNSKKFRMIANHTKKNDPSIKKMAETRVKAKTLKEFAELVLSSPSHRSMILNPKAETLGIGITSAKDKNLTVLITAELAIKSSISKNQSRSLRSKRKI